MSQPPCWLIGAGGHALVCADQLLAQGRLHGVIDPARAGQLWLDRVIQDEGDLSALLAQQPACVLGLGQVRAGMMRAQVHARYVQAGAVFPPLLAATAQVSPLAELAEAVQVGQRAVVQPGARLSAGVLVNSGAIIEHGARVGAFSHVSTAAVVNGDCYIGQGVMLGSGAIVLQGITIADGVTIGAGAVVTRDIRDAGVYVGVPARRVMA